MTKKLVFVLGDKLPTYYDAAISIFKINHKYKDQENDGVINSYAVSLIDIWKKLFGDSHVTSRSAVTIKLQYIDEHNHNNVYIKSH